ncbi:MAG TPA: glucosamine-6-phosphate deaminase [Bacteroidales bacterium]|nr:glucosamine-6-phosphate deaminase [Bacteroidales bacterium]
MRTFTKDKLKVEIFQDAAQMGAAAAADVYEHLSKAIAEKGLANIIIGTGASQYPLHDVLLEKDLDWSRVNVFHLDEYIGIGADHPASFRKFLRERIAEKVKPGNTYYIDGDTPDIVSEIRRYTKLLTDYPPDIACIGIGENGHIAFNDPGVADFNDTDYLKVVELDEACRRQQVGEGWYATIQDVPLRAVTLTVTAIMNSRFICCTVPDLRKAEAVSNALNGEIAEYCPASVLRRHNNAVLYLDEHAASKLAK